MWVVKILNCLLKHPDFIQILCFIHLPQVHQAVQALLCTKQKEGGEQAIAKIRVKKRRMYHHPPFKVNF